MDQGHAGYLQNLNSVIPGTHMTHRPVPDDQIPAGFDSDGEPLMNDEPFNVIDDATLTDDSNTEIPVLGPVSGLDLFTANSKSLSDSEKLDMIMAQLTMMQAAQANHDKAFQYLTGSMHWLTNMLGSVAQVAQSMPGMGGMMARVMGMGGKKNG